MKEVNVPSDSMFHYVIILCKRGLWNANEELWEVSVPNVPPTLSQKMLSPFLHTMNEAINRLLTNSLRPLPHNQSAH